MQKINPALVIFPFLIILLGFLPLLTLLHAGLPVTHDGKDHVARIANFYLGLTEGNLVPRWAPLLNWGYGHPVLMFLYPLPSYAASLFHSIGFGLVDSVKLVFGLSFILSGLAMYFFISAMYGRPAGFVSGMLYMFAPYRFVDLYVRGAIGEHVAFIFPPLICYFLYKAVKTKSTYSVVFGALSFAGLLLSHNAVSLMFIPVFFLFICFLLFKEKKRKFILFQLFLMFLFGFLMSSFFLVPAFLEGKYTLRDIVTQNEYLSRFESFGRFVYSSWSFAGTGLFSVQIGIVQWIVVLLQPFLIFYFYRKKSIKSFIFASGVFAMFFLSLFIMTELAAPIYKILTVLQKFQFPWRFLTLSVFFTAVMGGLLVSAAPDRLKFYLAALFGIGLIIASASFWNANSYLTYPESFYTSVYKGTTDTGESAPIWSVRFMLEEPEGESEVILGNADIKRRERSGTYREYEIIAKERSRIVENTLYFPGWKVLVNGKEEDIEFQDPSQRGLITYYVPEGKNKVEIIFGNTKLRTISEYATITGLIMVIVYVLSFSKISKWKVFR